MTSETTLGGASAARAWPETNAVAHTAVRSKAFEVIGISM